MQVGYDVANIVGKPSAGVSAEMALIKNPGVSSSSASSSFSPSCLCNFTAAPSPVLSQS